MRHFAVRIFVFPLFFLPFLGGLLAQSQIYVPHVVAGVDKSTGYGYFTRFDFINLSGSRVEVRIELFNEAGIPFKAFDCYPGMFLQPECGRSSSLITLERYEVSYREAGEVPCWGVRKSIGSGWAIVTFSEGSHNVKMSVSIDSRRESEDSQCSEGELASSTPLFLKPPGTNFTTFGKIIRGKERSHTFLTLFNPSESEEAEVEIRLRDDPMFREEVVYLAPRTKMSSFLYSLFPMPSSSKINGILEVTSFIPIVVAAFNVENFSPPVISSLPLFASAGLEIPYLRAEPNPIPVCEGELGRTRLFWDIPPEAQRNGVEIRIGSPDGDLFVKTNRAGSRETGQWVSDGMVFYLVDGETGAVYYSLTVRLLTQGCD